MANSRRISTGIPVPEVQLLDDEAYMRVFSSSFSAGVEAAEELSDVELQTLRRYTGIVGLVAEHVLLARGRHGTDT